MANQVIDTVATGDVTIIAAPTAGALRIHGFVLEAGGSDSIYFAAGVDSVKLSGTMRVASGTVVPYGPFNDGIWDLPAGTALIMNKAAAIQIGGCVTYTNPH